MLSVFSFIRGLRKQSTLLFSVSVDDLLIPATPHISQETEPKLRNSNLLAVFQTVMSGTDRNFINLNRSLSLTQFSTIPMSEIVIKTLSKEHFCEPLSLFSKLLGSSRTEETVCTYFKLNSYNHLNTTSLLSRKPRAQTRFLPKRTWEATVTE